MVFSGRAWRIAAAVMSSWLLAGGAAAADRAKVLNLYAWAEYFPATLIAKFQAQTGIHVNYAVLDSPETAETILSVGRSNNAAAVPLLEPAVRDNTLIYPPPAIRRRFELQRAYTIEETRAFTRAWLLFKSGL